jgi:hypothetical protein
MNHSIYFLFGGENYARNFLAENFAQEKFTTYQYDFFSIEDARSLRSFLSQHLGTTNVFLIRINKILGESQNALLKVCEEFTDGVLVFSFPSSTVLLDTFLSRGEVYREEAIVEKGAAKKAEAFLAASYLDRIKLFDAFIKENKDSDPRTFIRELIEGLIEYEKGNTVFNSTTQSNKSAYTDVLHLLTFQKSSPKQLFEYLALTIKK